MGPLDTNARARGQARRDRVEVTLGFSYLMYRGRGCEEFVVLTAFNHGDLEVRAVAATIQAESLPGRQVWDDHPYRLSSIPGVIPPGDSVEAYWAVSGLAQAGVDLTRSVRGGIQLPTGDLVWSRPDVLDEIRRAA